MTAAMSIATTKTTSSSSSSTAHNVRPATVDAVAAAVTPNNDTQIKKRTKAINEYLSIVDSYRTVPQAVRNKEKHVTSDVTKDRCVQWPAGDQLEKDFSNCANNEFIEHIQQTHPIMAAAAAAALAWARNKEPKASSDNVTLTKVKEAQRVPPRKAEATVDAPFGATVQNPIFQASTETITTLRDRHRQQESNSTKSIQSFTPPADQVAVDLIQDLPPQSAIVTQPLPKTQQMIISSQLTFGKILFGRIRGS